MADRNLNSIESDIEVTRARLASTIDQLVYRASPKTIFRREVASVKAYFVDPSGAPRQDHILKVAGGVLDDALAAVAHAVARADDSQFLHLAGPDARSGTCGSYAFAGS